MAPQASGNESAGEAIFFAHDKGIDQAITDYRTVYDATWKPAELFLEFVPALIRLAAELKALRPGIYYLEGTPAAAQFWIVWGGRAFICKLAHDKRFYALHPSDHGDVRARARGGPPARNQARSRRRPLQENAVAEAAGEVGITAANPRTVRGLQLGLRRHATPRRRSSARVIQTGTLWRWLGSPILL